jgi:hypothetical protein
MQEDNAMTLLRVARQQIVMQPRMQSAPKMDPPPMPSLPRRQGFLQPSAFGLPLLLLAILGLPAILGGINLLAQTHAPESTNPMQQKVAAEPGQPLSPAAEAIAARTSASPPPIRPPNQARVSWDSRGLEIEAFNSSLNQILHQVAAYTGARLEGLREDQRVFGSYGPGPGSDVLWKLLDGSGYNLLVIGGRDAGAPREIVLTARSSGAQTTGNRPTPPKADPLEPEPQPEPLAESPAPEQAQNPFGSGEPPREPLELMQDILQRQQKIDQQQPTDPQP